MIEQHPAIQALAEWAKAVADGYNFYDPRETDDLIETLVRDTPIVSGLALTTPD